MINTQTIEESACVLSNSHYTLELYEYMDNDSKNKLKFPLNVRCFTDLVKK